MVISREFLKRLLDDIKTSFWAIPALLMLLSLCLALFNFWIDTSWLPGSGFAYISDFFPFGWEGLRATLSTTASAVLGVAGVSFSITIASLTLASQQFGPRLIRTFIKDRITQTILGFFVATFLYCMLLLQLTAMPGAAVSPPTTTMLTVFALTVVDLLLLVIFIHRTCTTIQADAVIAEVSAELDDCALHMFPNALVSLSSADGKSTFDQLDEPWFSVNSVGAGYIQSIDYSLVQKCAVDNNLQIEVLHRAGSYLLGATALFQVWGRGERNSDADADADIKDVLQGSSIVGETRTPLQDSRFSVSQLVEIALRALSPGINDPFTAMNCIDRLGSSLVALASRDLPQQYVYDEDRILRLKLKMTNFDELVDTAFDQIRLASNGHIDIQVRVLKTIGDAISLVEHPMKTSALFSQAEMLFSAVDFDSMQTTESARIRQHFQAVEVAYSPNWPDKADLPVNLAPDQR